MFEQASVYFPPITSGYLTYSADVLWLIPLPHFSLQLQEIHCSYRRFTAATGDSLQLQKIHCSYRRFTAATGDSLQLQEIHCSYRRFTAATGDSLQLQKIHCSYRRFTAATGDSLQLQEIHCSYRRFTAATGDSLQLQEIHCSYRRFTAATGDSLQLQEIHSASPDSRSFRSKHHYLVFVGTNDIRVTTCTQCWPLVIGALRAEVCTGPYRDLCSGFPWPGKLHSIDSFCSLLLHTDVWLTLSRTESFSVPINVCEHDFCEITTQQGGDMKVELQQIWTEGLLWESLTWWFMWKRFSVSTH